MWSVFVVEAVLSRVAVGDKDEADDREEGPPSGEDVVDGGEGKGMLDGEVERKGSDGAADAIDIVMGIVDEDEDVCGWGAEVAEGAT